MAFVPALLTAVAAVASTGAAVSSMLNKPKPQSAAAPSLIFQAPEALPKPPDVEKVKDDQKQAVLALQKKRSTTILTRAAGLPDDTLNLGRASLLGQ